MLVEHGYAGLSMDRLAEATEYSKGTSYRMERPVFRAGFAPAEDPSLFTAHCYRNPATSFGAGSGLQPTIPHLDQLVDDRGKSS
jgi:hypothetical protein